MSAYPDRDDTGDSTAGEREGAGTVHTLSDAPGARRNRVWRARTARTRRILVDLAALGTYLAGLPDEQADAFAAAVGDDVAGRVRAAAADLPAQRTSRDTAPTPERPVAK